MNSKITLYSNEELIKEIKNYAKEHNTSVSKLVNRFFENLLHMKNSSSKNRITDSLTGILHKGDKEEYLRYLEEKYL
jgi:hypothetical protein